MKAHTKNPQSSYVCLLPVRWACFWAIVLALTTYTLSAQQTYIVTKVVDVTTGGCQIGDCSLRSAIIAANSDGQPSIIKFAFTTGTAPFTILVRGSDLPTLFEDDTTIDGLLDNSYNLGDVIIDGRLLASPTAIGLNLQGDNTKIYGLQIQDFNGNGIQAGATAGVRNITVGAAGKGNIIINNGGRGLFAPVDVNLTFSNNYVGTTPGFATGQGNGSQGINLQNILGALPTITIRNSFIADNGGGGITLDGNATYSVSGNGIGTNPAEANLGNVRIGIVISGITTGSAAVSNNQIAFNGRGVVVSDASPNVQISRNRIFCNAVGGILRSGGSPTVTITSATASLITGTSSSSEGVAELFIHDASGCAAGAPTPCQGKQYLGAATISGGSWSFNASGLVNTGDEVTATATTRVNPNTSVFSACQTVTCPAISIAFNSTASCAGQNTGSLEAVPSGGSPPYSFLWEDGTTSATLSDLAPGTYAVLVTDADGCQSRTTGQVDVLPAPTAQAGPDQSLCRGNSTTLNGAATGGSPPYQFSWSPGGDGASITVAPEVSTPYDLLVTDSEGCTDEDQLIVRVSGPQEPDAGPDQRLCAGQPASLAGTIGGSNTVAGSWTASVAGGTFDPDAGTLTATYTPPPGVMQVTLTLSTIDGTSECPDRTDEMTIEYTEGPTVDAGPDQTLCIDEPANLAGSIGGTGVSVGWTSSRAGGSFSPNAQSLTAVYTPPAGAPEVTLSLLARDGSGTCPEVRDQMTIIYQAPPTADAGPDQVSCIDQPVNISGIIGGGATSGLWSSSGDGIFGDATMSNTTYTPGPTDHSNLSVTLTLLAADGGVCPPASDALTVTFTAGPTADAGPDQVLCADETADLMGNIGGTAVSFAWIPSVAGGSFDPDSLSMETSYTPPEGATAVSLVLLAQDATGACPENSDTLTLTYVAAPTAAAGPDQEVCAGQVVDLAGTTGGSTASVLWTTSGDGTFSDAANANTSYTPGPDDINAQGTTLTLTANGNDACPPATDDLIVNIIPGLAYAVAASNPTTCSTDDGSISITGLNPGEPYTATYTFGGEAVNLPPQDADGAGQILIGNLATGSYTDLQLTDANGCNGDPVSLTLTDPGGPTLDPGSGPICVGQAGAVPGNATEGAPPYTHQWSDRGTGSASGFLLDNTDTGSLTIDATTAQAGTVDLSYQVTDANGCNSVGELTIEIVPGPDIEIIQLDSVSGQGISDGRAVVRLSGGVAPYTYTWSGPAAGTDILVVSGELTLDDLPAGSYEFQVSDDAGCDSRTVFEIPVASGGGGSGSCTTEAGNLQTPSGDIIQSCTNSAVRVVHLNDEQLAAGDVLRFWLRNAAGEILLRSATPVFNFDAGVLAPDVTYFIVAAAGDDQGNGTVDDTDPCLDISNAVSVIFRETLSGVLTFIQGEETLCQGDELILTTNDLGNIQYLWVTPARDTITTEEPLFILSELQTSDAGEYYVIARDGDCLEDQTGPFNLIVNGLPPESMICAGDDRSVCDPQITLSACDPGPGSGIWTTASPAFILNPNRAETSVSGLNPGPNVFIWTVQAPDCGVVGSDTVTIFYEQSLFAQPDFFTLERANTEIFMDVLKNDNIAQGSALQVEALSQPAFGELETLENGFRYYETEMRRGTVEFIYQICYQGGSCAGTCDTALVTIEVLNLPYLARGITPDGDGQNDELRVLGFTPGDSDVRMQLTIANQWGEIVFQSSDYTNATPWRGNYQGRPVPQGAYYCHIETTVPEGTFVRTQTVYVVR